MPEPDEERLKLTLVGDHRVGKTSFVNRILNNEFITDYTASVEASISLYSILFKADSPSDISIWDLPGQDQYKDLDKTFLIGADLAIFMYDITRKKTLENIKDWFRLTSERANPKLVSILIGNKVDLEDKRQVSSQEGQTFAKDLGLLWNEISIKENKNIKESLNLLITEYVKTISK